MIFDSPEMGRLRSLFAEEPDALWPLAVKLASYAETAGEREYIESLVANAPTTTRARWMKGLTSKADTQHLPAWFEVMLFGWLLEIGPVSVEPNVLGDMPDFALQAEGREVFIEAKTLLRELAERDSNRRLFEFMDIIEQIQLPYMVRIREFESGGRINADNLLASVKQWLDSTPNDQYCYRDKFGTLAHMSATAMAELKSVGVVEPGKGIWAETDKLKHALKKKAGQHSKLRKGEHPYVLAFFVEDWILSPEQFVRAWFGETEYIFNVESKMMVGQRLNQSGIHFGPNKIHHTSVSGTLIFRSEWVALRARRALKAWYIENPYAHIRIDPKFFPTESRFVVVSEDDQRMRMEWRLSNGS